MEKILNKIGAIVDLVFRAVGLAMGVAAVVLNLLGAVESNTIITLLAIGMFCLGVAALSKVDDQALNEI